MKVEDAKAQVSLAAQRRIEKMARRAALIREREEEQTPCAHPDFCVCKVKCSRSVLREDTSVSRPAT